MLSDGHHSPIQDGRLLFRLFGGASVTGLTHLNIEVLSRNHISSL
jgi:hypothetical protein